MGNKQQSSTKSKSKSKDAVEQASQKPRNIHSMYGPKPTTQQNSIISPKEEPYEQIVTLEPPQTAKFKDQKLALRLSRANRCGRSDGFYCHENNFDSLEASLKFVTKCYEIVSNLEINASIFSADELKEGMTHNLSRFSLMPLMPSIYTTLQEQQENGITNNNEQQSIEFPGLGEDNNEEDFEGESDFARPTALFGRANNRISISAGGGGGIPGIPLLKKDSSFGGETGGITLVSEASYEEPPPVRPTACFGDFSSGVPQIRGQRYAHLLQNAQNTSQSAQRSTQANSMSFSDENTNIYQFAQENQRQYIEEAEEDEEESEISSMRKELEYSSSSDQQQTSGTYYQSNSTEFENSDSIEVEVEPVYIKIDLSQKKRGKNPVIRQNPHHTIDTTSSQLKKSASKSPTAATQSSRSKTPTSHTKNNSSISDMKSSTASTSKVQSTSQQRSHSKSPSAGVATTSVNNSSFSSQSQQMTSKSPSHKSSKSQPTSYIAMSGRSMLKENLKNQDAKSPLSKGVRTEEKDIDSQIEELTGDIAVLDSIKADLNKVQQKIISDMSPSYRPLQK